MLFSPMWLLSGAVPVVARSALTTATRTFLSSAVAQAAPGAAAKAAAADKPVNSKTEAGLQELYMRALEPRPVSLPAVPAEELARRRTLAVAYTQHKWRRRLVRDRDLARKLALKWAAFHCLPTLERKREALVICPYVPLHRRMPSATPPLYGFAGRPAQASAVAAAEPGAFGPSGAAAPTAPAPSSALGAPSAGARRGSRRRGGSGGLSMLEDVPDEPNVAKKG